MSLHRTISRGFKYHAAGTPARLRREHVVAPATVALPALPALPTLPPLPKSPLPLLDLPRRELPERVLHSFVSKTIDFEAIVKGKAA